MALEQTYNRDVKESSSGLTGITLDEKARNKWLYTKPVTAATSCQLKEMLSMIPGQATSLHHDEGTHTHVDDMRKCITLDMINPFTSDLDDLINISTGQTATTGVANDLLEAEQIGLAALGKCLSTNGKKVDKVKLKTFHDMKPTKQNAVKKKQTQLTNEVVVLKRLLRAKTDGAEVSMENTIGDFECSNVPLSLFENEGMMRQGNKAMLFTTVKTQSNIQATEQLPESEKKTACVVDTMHFIRQRSFLVGETFDQFQRRCLRKLMYDLPAHCEILHVPGDRYDNPDSRKGITRKRRSSGKVQKQFQVLRSLATPPFSDFIISSQNKARLQDFMNTSWMSSES
ncbi:MAG: hypothetical protein ABW185_01410 [Sedimenticola sp.]